MKFLSFACLIFVVLLHSALAEEKKPATTVTQDNKETPKQEETKVEEATTKRIVTLQLASTERTISLSDAECKAMEAFFTRPSTRVHRDLREKFRKTCSFGVVG